MRLPDEKLLDLRLCDLDLTIKGTHLEQHIERVNGELADRGIRLRTNFWLSTEWFSPDGIPGVGVPFFLSHPRLRALERRQMLEIEGGSRIWCMRLLRHEVGHALDNAFRLRRKRLYRETFGSPTVPYPDFYTPRPFSRRYVLHLDYWYAQSHPCEDFAETFAIWLAPSSQWRKRYLGWPALKKLDTLDRMMKEIEGKTPPVTSRRRVDPIEDSRVTLREYYRDKRDRYGTEHPDFYDRDLRRLFSQDPRHLRSESAAAFLRRIRPDIRLLVARWTGLYQYTIDKVLEDMIARCRELKLRVGPPNKQLKTEAAILVTIQTMNYLHSGYHRVAL